MPEGERGPSGFFAACRGRACPARYLPRKRAPTYSCGRGMPRPYKPARKRVVIQSSAAHGRFVGEGLDPPAALMVPQASAERSRPLPTVLPVGAGHARPGTFPANAALRVGCGRGMPRPYRLARKRVVIQSSAVHGRFVGEGLDPPGALMVPQTTNVTRWPLPSVNAPGGMNASPTNRPENRWSSNHLPLLLSFTIYSKLHNPS